MCNSFKLYSFRLILYSNTLLLFLLTGCNSTSFKIEDFDPLSNYGENRNDSILHINADLSDAALNGIQIPSKTQTKNGYFKFKFKVENKSSEVSKYYYKIFYQNQTYKFIETHDYASENFYGSWSEELYTFKPTRFLFPGEFVEITDSFKIVGNPRNEQKYYGANPESYLNIDENIAKKINAIKSTPEWLSQVIIKAKESGTALEEQIYLDALWAINYEKNNEKNTNNRWKRNPRMGNYEFMLVVTTAEDFGKIPNEIRDLRLTDKEGKFNNPFGYFLHKDGKKLSHTSITLSEKKLNVAAKMDLGAGIFVDKLNINKSNFTTESINSNCNSTSELYHRANFQQYFHNIDKDFTVYNVPEIRDVVGENYTRAEYNEVKTKYADKNSRVKMFVNSTDCPCKTVISDSIKKSITMINPGVTPGNYKKEHVGISSRIGFTYGKIRAKIRFPKMLSKENVWNGITNAFWLLYQSESEWNTRRDCNADIAYIPKSEPDNNEALKHSKKTIPYSEIDFEIVKESRHWPKTSYKNSNIPYKIEDGSTNDDIMVTCTNWDMACHEPKDFNIGADEFQIDNVTEVLHRWDHFYKALSTKIPVKHSDIFEAPYYYFEIEWLPEKIIWKIGSEKNKMRTIAVMDNNVSAIPNNQMMLIFTQEWHNEEWWPTAPFKQNSIPFPKKDLIGEILEVTIE